MKKWHFSLTHFGLPLILLWAGASSVVVALNLFELSRSLELQTQSWFFRLRGGVTPPSNLIILAMDEDTTSQVKFLQQDQEQQAEGSSGQGLTAQQLKDLEPLAFSPWKRRAYATVIDRLMAGGARSVAVDVVFDLPSTDQEDQLLQQTLQRHAGRITLAAIHDTSASVGGGLEQLLLPYPLFQTNPGSIGLINYLPDNDQHRRFPWVYIREQLPPELLPTQTELLSFTEATLKAANQSTSPPRGDYIFFYGGQNTFPAISFWRVLDSSEWNKLLKQGVFKDKIVLIGPTEATSQDFHFTPFGRLPGIEIHANAIASLLENRAIGEAIPDPLQQGIFVFLGIAGTGWLVSRLSKRAIPRSLMCLGIATVWVGIGYLCFTVASLILPVTVPALAIALSGLTFLGTGAIGDLLERLRLRRTLERYLAAPVVAEILSQPEDYQTLLQGRELKAAVLFCDIRGFTTLSYKLPAQELVAQLNVYLNAMVDAITEARGTIDKFIGDAVMAEFGAPVSEGEKNDAMNAIRAALGMRRALADLRKQWREEGKTLFYNGIGISYGEVIAGNIGSLRRLEYTVIGDAVNVASRVEGLTKNFMTDILITGALYELVQDEVEAVFVGEHSLRGRGGQTPLYSVVGLKGNDQTLYCQVHSELNQYLKTKES